MSLAKLCHPFYIFSKWDHNLFCNLKKQKANQIWEWMPWASINKSWHSLFNQYIAEYVQNPTHLSQWGLPRKAITLEASHWILRRLTFQKAHSSLDFASGAVYNPPPHTHRVLHYLSEFVIIDLKLKPMKMTIKQVHISTTLKEHLLCWVKCSWKQIMNPWKINQNDPFPKTVNTYW